MDISLSASPAVVPAGLTKTLGALCDVAADLSLKISHGPLGPNLGAAAGASNADGDTQRALDVMADEAFMAALTGTGVRHYASEEQETITEIDPAGRYALAIDPLDGSSNIDVNVSIGTIFGISEAADSAEESFLRSGRSLIAAGYFIYGPATTLVVTFGDGVHQYVLVRENGTFVHCGDTLQIPGDAREFAINASNYQHWSKPVRALVDDFLAGEEGPCGTTFNMRWIASLVAETHRILTRGGIFLYPDDAREGYARGRLRLIYECAPIAFLVEQAGGKATDGMNPILDQVPETLHGRAPFVFGCSRNVDRLTVYHDLPPQEISALFAPRGLFRA